MYSSLFNQNLLLPTKKVLDSYITALKFDEQIQTILGWAKERESRYVCVANVHMVMEAYWHAEFAKVKKNADLVTPDGMPLVWMMRLMGMSDQNRVAGMDILLALCQFAPLHGTSVFFVGSHSEVQARMRGRLEREFPNLQIAGMEPLPFRPLTPAEDEALIERINQSGAGLVLVALGCPKQEYWMAQHKDKIQSVMIGLGGVFPVYAGLCKQTPRWIQRLGLEWSYRLIQEPRRLWKRYSKTIPPFMWLACKQLLAQSRGRSSQTKAVSPSPAAHPARQPMPEPLALKPLGQILRRAGLLSQEQVEETLQVQTEQPHLRFGEILVLQGWLAPETVTFFAEELPKLVTNQQKQPSHQGEKIAAH
jgi:N-acetylglucosaminyldiphosphoundecaprenol N-acetyl-beta-D-mannosaminyltransferase